MRPAARLLASVKPGRFLEANSPTGLTGLFTHPAPRSSLIYLYSSTLDKLKQLPESSVYRQSTEALTRHRLKIVESIKPEGYDEWAAQAKKKVEENPEVFNKADTGAFKDGATHEKVERDGRSFVNTRVNMDANERTEWDGEPDEGQELEGPSSSLKEAERKTLTREIPQGVEQQITWEPEPPLEATQVSEIETQIGAGLLEEVINVAEGELKLVDQMAANKSWEELEEKPPEGQWKYFERDTATGKTQAP
ncbi:MAG: hypothetical protein M4579_002226 [Chaenotheca gracillima]|nr:MAG: hypothetical protein M4579_002226 [Chaenotheca gracillima]